METTTRSIADSTFPSSLLDLAQTGLASCERLRTRGPWPPPPGIAIVGTRHPDEHARAFTRSLAAEICATGLAVWSGGARGIDAAAHEGALDAGGCTVVVVPSGLEQPYPREHAALFDRVLASGGTVVSPFADATPPMVPSFHKRNAVLAALTIATVVVQAGVKSGARSTARAARRLGRPLYVVPHAPWDPIGAGCAIELVGGATAIVSSATLLARLRDRVLSGAGLFPEDRLLGEIAHEGAAKLAAKRRSRSSSSRVTRARATHEQANVAKALAREHASREHAGTRPLHDLDASARRVLEAIGEVPIHLDDLCERTALSAASVTAALLTLTLGAVVVEAPAGFYRLSTI